jgi:hypothetical protein
MLFSINLLHPIPECQYLLTEQLHLLSIQNKLAEYEHSYEY